MKGGDSLLGRSVLAIALMAGFYLLALGLAGVLAYLPYAEYVYGRQIHIRLLLFCIGGAALIVWSVLPRRDRFTAPGPQLTAADQPQLHALIASVARDTHQLMPAEVYLVPDVNAWVAERGGFLGIGGRRVMGIGLPLLQVLSVAQLRGVLAHEFGHYHGGDTRLGPFIYKTRAAIGRTLVNLQHHSALLQKPFEWYGMLFLRVTQAISRRQELLADSLAVSLVGSAEVAGGLRTVHSIAPVYASFWQNEVVPVLQSGFSAPLADGFSRFLAAPRVAEAVQRIGAQQLEEGAVDPYDSHPPLAERLAALPTTAQSASVDSTSAITLLPDVDRLEQEILHSVLVRPGAALSVRKIAWDEVLEHVWVPRWQSVAHDCGAAMAQVTTSGLVDVARQPHDLAVRLDPAAEAVPEEQQRRLVGSIVGMALALVLRERGWRLHAPVGDNVSVIGANATLRPFEVIADLSSGAMSAEAWRDLCVRSGIADLALGSLAIPTTSALAASALNEPGTRPNPSGWSHSLFTALGAALIVAMIGYLVGLAVMIGLPLWLRWFGDPAVLASREAMIHYMTSGAGQPLPAALKLFGFYLTAAAGYVTARATGTMREYPGFSGAMVGLFNVALDSGHGSPIEQSVLNVVVSAVVGIIGGVWAGRAALGRSLGIVPVMMRPAEWLITTLLAVPRHLRPWMGRRR